MTVSRILLLAWLTMHAFDMQCQSMPDTFRIIFRTSAGDIHAELYPSRAPLTCANFVKYVEAVGSAGGEFYRTVTLQNQPDKNIRIEVIQGGFNLGNYDTALIQPVPLERTCVTGLKHLNGTLSMARSDPDSGTTEFFICINDQPSLDFGGKRNPDGQGFAAFGRVTAGMEIVKKIQRSPADGQSLTPPVKILEIALE
jgi:peptidyl-prolyl cis-trans isomerase A (cyclophilin A)